MEERSIFLNLSPLDHRYFLANRKVFERLAEYLSEEASVRYCIRIELTLLTSLMDAIPDYKGNQQLLAAINGLENGISTREIYEEEARTHHNIRALVNVLKRKVPQEVKHLVHLGATSVDILDTSASMRIRDAVRKVLLPLLIELEESLIRLSEREAGTIQIGRTHGQHAVPITFGFAIAEYVSRLGKSIQRMDTKSLNLRGKLAGAVGAYNAMTLVIKNAEDLEGTFLARLGLKASEHSTQMIEPEYLLELLTEIGTAFGIIANLADDLRNLQRSEIGEVCELFSQKQVGSSTMPQKRNPWNSEHVKSLWKAFSPRILSFFMDQISEHQRDLTNSASMRFVADYISGFAAAANRMRGIISSLSVNRERMAANLESNGVMSLSEAAYILLSLAGESEGHEILREATLEAERSGRSLADLLKDKPVIWNKLNQAITTNLEIDAETFLANPANYCGFAEKKTRKIAARYAKRMADLTSLLGTN